MLGRMDQAGAGKEKIPSASFAPREGPQDPRPTHSLWSTGPSGVYVLCMVCLHSRVSVSLCARPCARVGYLCCRARSSEASEDGVNVCM